MSSKINIRDVLNNIRNWIYIKEDIKDKVSSSILTSFFIKLYPQKKSSLEWDIYIFVLL